MLYHPDFKEQIYSFSGASDKLHSGALLQQHGKQLTLDLHSRMFNDEQVKCCITSKEVQAPVQPISKWHNYS